MVVDYLMGQKLTSKIFKQSISDWIRTIIDSSYQHRFRYSDLISRNKILDIVQHSDIKRLNFLKVTFSRMRVAPSVYFLWPEESGSNLKLERGSLVLFVSRSRAVNFLLHWSPEMQLSHSIEQKSAID